MYANIAKKNIANKSFIQQNKKQELYENGLGLYDLWFMENIKEPKSNKFEDKIASYLHIW